MLKKLLVAGLLLFSNVDAATYYASSSQTGSGHSGADSTTNAFTLAEVNAKTNFADGDIVQFRTGTYSGSLDPSDNGSASGFLTFKGFVTAPGAVTFTGNCTLDSTASNGNGDYIVVKGMTFNGSYSNGGTGYYHARWDSLTWCNIKTSFSADGGYHFVYNCTIGDGDVGDTFTWSYPGGSGDIHWAALGGSKRNKLVDCTLNLAINSVVNAPIQWRDQDSLEITRCRHTAMLGASSGAAFPWGIYGMTNSTITDCYFAGQQLAGSSAYFPNIRDIVSNNTWVRDTIVEIPGGSGALKVAFMTSGNTDVTNEYNGRNSYNNLYVRLRGAVYYQDRCNGDTHKFCTYIVDGNAGIANDWAWADSTTIYHCSFINLHAAAFNADGVVAASSIKKTLFVSGAHVVCNGQVDVGTTSITSDSNMVWNLSANSTDISHAFDTGGCTGYAVGSSSAWCTTHGHDCASRWADPILQDSTSWSLISPYPNSSSVAEDDAVWGSDGYVGALTSTAVDLAISTTSLTVPVRGSAYCDTIVVTGGTLPLTWSIVLDNGFSYYEYYLDPSTGIITNADVQDQGAIIDVVILVTDALGDTVSKAYNIVSTDATAPFGFAAAQVTCVSDNSASVYFAVRNDADTSGTALVLYGTDSPSDTALAPTRILGKNYWYTRLFGLSPNTAYQVLIRLTDGAESPETTLTITTKSSNWWQVAVKGPLVYVDKSKSDANDGLTPASAKKTVSAAWTALLAQPNHGKGGGICLVPGTVYYGTGLFEDTGNYATADSMYHIISDGTATWSGSDERLVTGTIALSWATYGTNGAYYTVYTGVDSCGAVFYTPAGGRYTRCLAAASRLEALNGASPLTSSTPRWWKGGGDTLVVYTTGVSPSTQSVRVAYWSNLCFVITPYVRVHGINFTMAGGSTTTGIAVRLGAYNTASHRVAGCVVDSCKFQYTAYYPLFSVTAASAFSAWYNDSVVVAGNSFFDDCWKFTYSMQKSRAEEIASMMFDGSYWVVRDNKVRGYFNGIGIQSAATDTNRAVFLEIYNDTITYVRDDGIELDLSHNRNSFVAKCTIIWCGSGISITPCRGGPTYIIYNTILRPVAGGGFKVGGAGTGTAYYYHNTVYNPSGSTAAGFYNAAIGAFQRQHFRNNILVGAASAYEPVTNQTTGADTVGAITNTFNWDNLFVWSGTTVFRWKNVAYDSNTVKSAIRTEMNGIFSNPLFSDTTCWKDTTTTTAGVGVAFAPRGRARNTAVRISGINDRNRFVVNQGAPDIGSIEYTTLVEYRRGWLSRLFHLHL